MTCVVAISERGHVYLGADSLVACDDAIIVSRDPKVWQAGPFVVGAAGHAVWWELLRESVQWERVARGESEREFRQALTYEIRTRATEIGVDLRDVDAEDPVTGSALVGVGGDLFLVDNYLTVQRVAEPFVAIGSGASPALGALYATQRSGKTPRARLTAALTAAERYCTTVRRPWRWVSV